MTYVEMTDGKLNDAGALNVRRVARPRITGIRRK